MGLILRGNVSSFIKLKNIETSKKEVKRTNIFFLSGLRIPFFILHLFQYENVLAVCIFIIFMSSKMKLLRGPSSNEGFLEMCLDSLTNEISLFVGYKSKGLSQVLIDVSL